MNEIAFTRGLSRTCSASELGQGTTLTDPAGAPASTKISPSDSAESGVFEAGRTTQGHPAAKAGASLCATSRRGALYGVIASTVPTGNRRVQAMRPSPFGQPSMGTISPVRRRASSPAARRTSTHLLTSRRVSQIAFPVSRVICVASSSPRPRTSSAERPRISARSWGGSAAIDSRASSAAAMACSSSGASASQTRPISRPS